MPLPLEISCHDAQQLLADEPNCILIDCRETDEHDLVHIDGARLLPMTEIEQRFGELVKLKDRRIVVHCHHGGRSARVAVWLRENGFDRAQSMAGGIDQWAQQIDPSLSRY